MRFFPKNPFPGKIEFSRRATKTSTLAEQRAANKFLLFLCVFGEELSKTIENARCFKITKSLYAAVSRVTLRSETLKQTHFLEALVILFCRVMLQ
ncbi:hypothetical protein CEXT_599491 [Caerostris extrusa]|uniref:Uncharacterized protein n=1 Tax=Caerostris extrusa TaxID=172846 RepID=A0AAV4TDV2_CAEEX|nr:hypothetical protein CEXT_599491 [Caerostris extrusa]